MPFFIFSQIVFCVLKIDTRVPFSYHNFFWSRQHVHVFTRPIKFVVAEDSISISVNMKYHNGLNCKKIVLRLLTFRAGVISVVYALSFAWVYYAPRLPLIKCTVVDLREKL
jgi:hypothetical protein